MLGVVAALVVLLVLVQFASYVRHQLQMPRGIRRVAWMEVTPTRGNEGAAWTDRFDDGTPDFLRLSDPADQAAFRRWFTLIAEYQAIRPKAEVPAEITDCASLLRYSYREALKRHDETWFTTTGWRLRRRRARFAHGAIRTRRWVRRCFGCGRGRSKPRMWTTAPLRSLPMRERWWSAMHTLVSRDVRQALPGDLLFYRQFGQSSPWHSMIVTRVGAEAAVVYDTGEDHRSREGRASCAAWRWPNCSTIHSRNGGRSLAIRTFSVSTAGIFCEELHESSE